MSDPVVQRALERAQAASDAIDESRAVLEAAMEKLLPVLGTKGLIILVAGVQMGVVERYLARNGGHG